jgi:MFS superfamily sulfate permease-like transporter
MDNIQKTALKETAKTLAGLTAVALLVPAAIYMIPLKVLGTLITLVALGFVVKMIYDTKLDQAKFEEHFDKGVDKKVDQ